MENNFNVTRTEDGKSVAIVSYITIIGWLIAYFGMHKDKRTELGSFHLRQTLLLYIVAFILQIVQRIILSIAPSGFVFTIFSILSLIIFILWIIGLIGAIQGTKKEIPLIGQRAQSMFPNI
ncbi:putative membrane protein [Pedobacter cryoconitis]|uniref:Putative membrane protein n=1 Tax=Pedobacter cryoconitis TaxID=188932 RepID=A0A7W9DM79_9SPHI|nr:hypothetical protein [Pedobacter cryoconitis]MBB5624052.1 putative membrane protein [Pedobacter cryoconitis]MBB5647286.1 putative membrane protein [Pedobacter cryoconitis]